MRDFLESLRYVSTSDTVSLRSDLVRDVSFEQMCGILDKSNEADWKKNPSYYKALSERFTPDNMAKLIQDDLDSQNWPTE